MTGCGRQWKKSMEVAVNVSTVSEAEWETGIAASDTCGDRDKNRKL
jgi:hypothetical protein